MRILWLCNIMLPMIAEQLHMESSQKEGWLTGLADRILREQESLLKAGKKPEITLGICFPTDKAHRAYGEELPYVPTNGSARGNIPRRAADDGEKMASYHAYGFQEKLSHAEQYDPKLQKRMEEILQEFQPDVIHIFGTEYPHDLAMLEACKAQGITDRAVLNLQGICSEYAKVYRSHLPEKVWKRRTFRDVMKRDSLPKQQKRMEKRGETERLVLRQATHVIGRTDFDRHWVVIQNPDMHYHFLNETLRPEFYEGRWNPETCEPHRIFMSQGDYPIKGLHYALKALPKVLEQYPDTRLCVAGNSIIKSSLGHGVKRILGKIKLESYGVYIRDLIKKNRLKDHVVFLGRLNAQQMKAEYLKANLYLCTSSIENSPNSVGEAMILGTPAACGRVGGIPTIFSEGTDGSLFTPENLEEVAEAICKVFEGGVTVDMQTAHARAHAQKTHDPETNYRRLLEIYREITG